MEDILDNSEFKFDGDSAFDGSEGSSVEFMNPNEKKDIEKTVNSLKNVVNMPKQNASSGKKEMKKNTIYAVIILICIGLMVGMGYGAYGFYKGKEEKAELKRILSIEPQGADTCVGAFAIRVFPNGSGDKSFMKKPIKIIAVKDNMINYIDENGYSNVLKEEFCDDNWMKWEDYQKLRDIGKDTKGLR